MHADKVNSNLQKEIKEALTNFAAKSNAQVEGVREEIANLL